MERIHDDLPPYLESEDNLVFLNGFFPQKTTFPAEEGSLSPLPLSGNCPVTGARTGGGEEHDGVVDCYPEPSVAR